MDTTTICGKARKILFNGASCLIDRKTFFQRFPDFIFIYFPSVDTSEAKSATISVHQRDTKAGDKEKGLFLILREDPTNFATSFALIFNFFVFFSYLLLQLFFFIILTSFRQL